MDSEHTNTYYFGTDLFILRFDLETKQYYLFFYNLIITKYGQKSMTLEFLLKN